MYSLAFGKMVTKKNSCVLKHYPRRFEYVSDAISISELKELVLNKNGGISLEFPDHPSQRPTLLRWTEVNSVQLFVENFRGDIRPQVDLRERNRTGLYYNELRENFYSVKDDPLRLSPHFQSLRLVDPAKQQHRSL